MYNVDNMIIYRTTHNKYTVYCREYNHIDHTVINLNHQVQSHFIILSHDKYKYLYCIALSGNMYMIGITSY